MTVTHYDTIVSKGKDTITPMATEAERITQLEQAIKELNMNSTVLLGLASDHEIDIRKLSVQIASVQETLDEHTSLLHLILEKLDRLPPKE